MVGPAVSKIMKKISEARRESVEKMSDVRLSSILLQLGYTLEQLEAMDRPDMLNAYAELIVAGKDKPPAVAAAVVAASAGMAMVVADPEVQKQLVQLEMAKLEEARREREEQIRFTKENLVWERRFKAEELELRKQELVRQQEKDRLKAENLDWERRFKAEELELRKQELVRQQEKDRLKAERFGATMGARMRPNGDTIRNATFRSRHESMDALTFFEHCDKIFEDVNCSNSIRTQLILPFLSDRAKQLLSQLDPAKTAECKDLKQYILDELKLNPATYMEMFNNVKRTENETCATFVSKLRTLLGHYVQSRHVEESYEKLFSLLVCDRVKATLPERCLRHVLALESNTTQGWLDTTELADQVDLYLQSTPNLSDTATPICAPTQSAASRDVVTNDDCNKTTVSNTTNANVGGGTSSNTEATESEDSSTNSCRRRRHSTEHREETSMHQFDDSYDQTDVRIKVSVSTPASPTAVKGLATPRTPVRNGSMAVRTNSPAVREGNNDNQFADVRATNVTLAAVNACISLPFFPG